MYVIEITPHPSDVDVRSLLLRFPAQIERVTAIIEEMIEGFAFDEDADGPEPWEVKVEIKDMPLDEIVSTIVGLDEHWKKEIEAAIAMGEQCSDWPVGG